tara:strand:+ start:53300 stop:54019 length:720 start_codon:yes stop_codon:yes gene_type:complete
MLSSLTMADSTNVAVAANFKPTLLLLQNHFQAQSGHRLIISSASTGVLFNQISHGAPFDVLLAADVEHPQKLEHAGLTVAHSGFTYAQGQLVLASLNHTLDQADESSIRQQLRLAKTIAIANPALAPYGLAAQQSLSHLQLWPPLPAQLIRGNNISQAQQFLMTGNVQWAFIPLSPLLVEQGVHYWLIPRDWYQPIRQQAILLQSGRHNEAALAFMTFLQSDVARHLIAQQGYILPSRN